MATWLDNQVYTKFRGTLDLGDLADTFHAQLDAALPPSDAPTPSDSLTNPTIAPTPPDLAVGVPPEATTPPVAALAPSSTSAPPTAGALPAPNAPVTAPLVAPVGNPPARGDFQSALDWAHDQIGKPYIWGSAGGRTDLSGNAPGFDCSGFVSQFYHQMGRSLPAQTLSAYNVTTHVDPKDAQAGDIVEWMDPRHDASQEHMAIYLGGGRIFQSGGSSHKVNIGDINQFGPGTFEFRRAAGAPTSAGDMQAGRQVASTVADAAQTPATTSASQSTDNGLQAMADEFHKKLDATLSGAGQAKDTLATSLGQTKDAVGTSLSEMSDAFHKKLDETLSSTSEAAGNELLAQGRQSLPTPNLPTLEPDSAVARQARGETVNPFDVKNQAVGGLASSLGDAQYQGPIEAAVDPANLPGGIVNELTKAGLIAGGKIVSPVIGALASSVATKAFEAFDTAFPPTAAHASTGGLGDLIDQLGHYPDDVRQGLEDFVTAQSKAGQKAEDIGDTVRQWMEANPPPEAGGTAAPAAPSAASDNPFRLETEPGPNRTPLTPEQGISHFEDLTSRYQTNDERISELENRLAGGVEGTGERGGRLVRPTWAAGWSDEALLSFARKNGFDPHDPSWGTYAQDAAKESGFKGTGSVKQTPAEMRAELAQLRTENEQIAAAAEHTIANGGGPLYRTEAQPAADLPWEYTPTSESAATAASPRPTPDLGTGNPASAPASAGTPQPPRAATGPRNYEDRRAARLAAAATENRPAAPVSAPAEAPPLRTWDANGTQVTGPEVEAGKGAPLPVGSSVPAPADMPSLPSSLAKSNPRYAIGPNQFQLNFASDVDKALYIVAQKTPSKADEQFMAFLRKQFPDKSDAELRQMGNGVRSEIKTAAQAGDPSEPLQIAPSKTVAAARSTVTAQAAQPTAPAIPDYERISQKYVQQAREGTRPTVADTADPTLPPETWDAEGNQVTGPPGSGLPPTTVDPSRTTPSTTDLSRAIGKFRDLQEGTPPNLGKMAWGALAEGKKSIFSLTNFHPLTIAEGTALGPAGPAAGLRVAATYIGGVVRGSTIDALRTGHLAPWFDRAEADGVRLLGKATNNPETGGAAAGALSPLATTAARATGGAVTGFAGTYESSKAAGTSDEDALRNGLIGGGTGAVLGPTLAMRMHDALWHEAVPLAKVLTYKAAVEGGVAGPEAATFANNLAGGQNLAQIAGSSEMETVARLVVQSPDWLLSQLKLAGAGLKGTAKSIPGVENLPKMGPMTGNEQLSRDWLLKTLGVGTVATELLNLAFTGHLTNENQPGHQFQVEVPTGTANKRGDVNTTVSLFPGNLQGLLNLASSGNLGNFVENRLGPVVTIPFGLMANQRYPGGPPITTTADTGPQERVKQGAWAASRFAPIGITSAAQQSLYHAPLPLIGASALTGLNVSHDTAVRPPVRRGAPLPVRSPRAPLPQRPTGRAPLPRR